MSTSLITAACVAVALLYLWGSIHFHIPVWRATAFFCGLFTVWLGIGSPLAMLDEQLLTAHMVQHILLMMVAAPLLLFGSPGLSLLHGLPARLIRPGQSLAALAMSPVFCWFAATAVVIGWHVPAAFELALRSELWHHVEHATFLAAGLLFWLPVIPAWPNVSHSRWSIVLYLFLATLPCDALSAFLAFCGRVVYSSYLDVPRHFNLSPLQDQECAGALMWTCATFAYLIPAVLITTRLLTVSSSDETRISAYTGPASRI